jgi:hypothetical protein
MIAKRNTKYRSDKTTRLRVVFVYLIIFSTASHGESSRRASRPTISSWLRRHHLISTPNKHPLDIERMCYNAVIPGGKSPARTLRR